jgi:hypothetical protein
MRYGIARLAAAGLALAAAGYGARAEDSLAEVRVQYSIRMPLKSDDTTAQSDAMEQGRKTLYQARGSECALIISTIASSCRLEGLNVQSNVVRQPGRDQAVNLSANARLKVVLKDDKP